MILSEKPIKYESKNNRTITAKRSDYYSTPQYSTSG